MAGNPRMLIWLGKQWLGQSERVEHTMKDDPLDGILEELRKESKRLGPPENSERPGHAEEEVPVRVAKTTLAYPSERRNESNDYTFE